MVQVPLPQQRVIVGAMVLGMYWDRLCDYVLPLGCWTGEMALETSWIA